MTYTLKHSDWQWLIEPQLNTKKYLLKYRRPTAWTECGSFDTPEAAANAVAKGETGEKDWDNLNRDLPDQSLASWLIDPAGGVLAPILPAIAGILKGTILPPSPEAGSRA
jgi:hypothetical protein